MPLLYISDVSNAWHYNMQKLGPFDGTVIMESFDYSPNVTQTLGYYVINIMLLFI